jgi:hypothetical protein
MDVALAASMEPGEGRFAAFALAYLEPRGDRRQVEEFRFDKEVPLGPGRVVKLAASTDLVRESGLLLLRFSRPELDVT